MRLALISDIHGNLPAFQAVLDRIDHEGVDAILCLGDTVGYGPFPSECIDLMMERGIPSVLGNHDACIVDKLSYNFFGEPNRSLLHWTRDLLRPDQIAWLEGLPMVIEHRASSQMPPPPAPPPLKRWRDDSKEKYDSVGTPAASGGGWGVELARAMSMLDAQCSMLNVSFIAAHASPIHPERWQWLDSAITCREVLAQIDYDFVFVGHTHVPALVPSELGVFALEHGYKYVVNPGSIGQGRDHDRRASFGILDFDAFTYQNFRVHYDTSVLKAGFNRLGYSTDEAKLLIIV